MLKIIDRYIIRKYLSAFFFTALIFTLIATIIDFSEKVESFIKEPCTKTEIVFDYYVNFIPYINGLLWPLFSLIAVIFFTSRMAFNTEIIPILEAGVSFRRMMRPYLVAASVIVLLLLLLNHFIIPIGNKKRLRFEHTYVWKTNDRGKTDNVHMYIAPGTKAYIRYYRKQDTIANDLRIERFEGNQLRGILEASTAQWKGYPNHWRLNDWRRHTFDGLNETLQIGTGKDLDTTLNITPEDFVRYINQKEMMSSLELLDFINTEHARGLTPTKSFELEIHRRTADPFTILILTVIGMAVASRKVRGGMGLHLAVGMGLGALFILLSKFSSTFVTNQNLPALIGVWIPNFFFIAVAVYLVFRAQK